MPGLFCERAGWQPAYPTTHPVDYQIRDPVDPENEHKTDIRRATTAPSTHIPALVDRVLEASEDSRYIEKKEMWTRHNRLERTAKTPVYVCLKRGSGTNANPVTWSELIPFETRLSEDALEREIELQLRQKLYKHDNIPDDEVLSTTVWVGAVRAAAEGDEKDVASGRIGSSFDVEHVDGAAAGPLWGMPFVETRVGGPGGAYAVEPAVVEDSDLDRLHWPPYRIDERATAELRDRAAEMVGGRLPVKVATDAVGCSPTETMISLMGMEAMLYGVIDRPEFMHRIMDFVTEGTIKYQLAREATGGVDYEQSWNYRVPYEELPADADPHSLSSCWPLVAAQSMCGISPAMYEEFVQPYHARLTQHLGQNRVYYHGCEDLTEKIPSILKLPNLRRLHISPWTDLERASELVQRDFVMEVVPHPDTLYGQTPEEMRAWLERAMDIAGDLVIDLVLGEIETVMGEPDVLSTWTKIAQEVVQERA